MKNHILTTGSSTIQEWANFLTLLNHTKNNAKPLLKNNACYSQLVYHLNNKFYK